MPAITVLFVAMWGLLIVGLLDGLHDKVDAGVIEPENVQTGPLAGGLPKWKPGKELPPSKGPKKYRETVSAGAVILTKDQAAAILFRRKVEDYVLAEVKARRTAAIEFYQAYVRKDPRVVAFRIRLGRRTPVDANKVLGKLRAWARAHESGEFTITCETRRPRK